MDLSKIINKVLLESDGVEEFYGVEEYTKDTQMEQEIKKLANVLRPFIQRVARESMYIVDRNKKEIRNRNWFQYGNYECANRFSNSTNQLYWCHVQCYHC